MLRENLFGSALTLFMYADGRANDPVKRWVTGSVVIDPVDRSRMYEVAMKAIDCVSQDIQDAGRELLARLYEYDVEDDWQIARDLEMHIREKSEREKNSAYDYDHREE